jgi:hypothetical protein
MLLLEYAVIIPLLLFKEKGGLFQGAIHLISHKR